jgi:PIN domain nuclease of toxin-antitoxin system
VILLDTNALIWLASGHRRAAPLRKVRPLHVSPASLLELHFLAESGRVRLTSAGLAGIADDPRWNVDEPPSGDWFQAAWPLGWTRDPFDRLIVAHATLRRWKLATADGPLVDRLGPARVILL